MKTLVKKIGLVLIVALTSLNVMSQDVFEEYKMDSVSFINLIDNNHYTSYNPDSLVIVKGMDGDLFSANTIKSVFWGLIENDSMDLVSVSLKMRKINSQNVNRSVWVEEKINVLVWENDNDNELGEGTTIIGGVRENGDWFFYSQNIDKNLYSFHFLDDEEKKETIIYATKK